MRLLPVLLGVTLLLPGCISARTMSRSVEVDASADAAFRAAAATLLDGGYVFDLSDREAGLVCGSPGQAYGPKGRTTFWITPLDGDHAFVVVQSFNYGYDSPEASVEQLDWLVNRLRQRLVLAEPE